MKTEDIQPRQSIAGLKVAAKQLTKNTQAVVWIRPSDKKRVYPIYTLDGEYQNEILENLEEVEQRIEGIYKHEN
jgi:hypothetical protein